MAMRTARRSSEAVTPVYHVSTREQEVASTMHIPSHAPVAPFIYLDWNTVQHLRKVPAFGPLLMAVLDAQTQEAALLPYSEGHLMDATAGWATLAPEYRAERLRDLTFLSGLSSEEFWEIHWFDVGDVHRLRSVPCIEACRGLNYLVSLYDGGGTDPGPRAIGPKGAQGVREGITAMREALKMAPNLSASLMDGLIGHMEEMIDSGIPEMWEMGGKYTTSLAPVADFASTSLPSFDHTAPAEAIGQIDKAIQRLAPGMTFAKVLDNVLPGLKSGGAGLHPDDIGPMLIGLLGYHREQTRAMRRGAPGLYPDQIHGRHALSSAIFITSEVRLPQRIEAWAAHTHRGSTHDTWPIVLHAGPDNDGSILESVEVVTAYTRAFSKEVRRFRASIASQEDDVQGRAARRARARKEKRRK